MNSNTKGERIPGFFEKFYICRSVNEYGCTVNMTAKYNRKVNDKLLSNALRSLVLKNSRLFANFFTTDNLNELAKNNGSSFLLKLALSILYEDVVQTIEFEGNFDENIVEELNSIELEINRDIPTWKLIIHENENEQYISFCFNHTLFDGNSGKHFHEDLLKELEFFSKQGDLKYISRIYDASLDIDRPDLPEDSDDIVDFYKAGKLFIFKSLAELLVIPEWIKLPFNIARNKYPNTYKYPIFQTYSTKKGSKTKYKLVKIEPECLNSVLQECRTEKFTLTPYMTSVAMQALQEKFFPHWSNTEYSFHITVAVDGRRYVPELKEKTRYGLYIGGINAFFGPFFGDKSNGIKRVAMNLHQIISNNIMDQTPFKFSGLLRLINIWDFFSNKLGKPNRETILVSNLGMLKNSSDDWMIDDMFFTQSNGIYTHFGISLISTANGGLNICFSYLEEDNKITDNISTIDQFIEYFRESLLNTLEISALN